MFKGCKSIILEHLQDLTAVLSSLAESQAIYSAYLIILPYLTQLLSFLSLVLLASFLLISLINFPRDQNRTQLRLRSHANGSFRVLLATHVSKGAEGDPIHECCQELKQWVGGNFWGYEQEMILLVPRQEMNSKIGEDPFTVYEVNDERVEAEEDQDLMIKIKKANGADHLQEEQWGGKEYLEELETNEKNRIVEDPIRVNQGDHVEADQGGQVPMVQSQELNGIDHLQKGELEELKTLLYNRTEEGLARVYQVTDESKGGGENQELMNSSYGSSGDDDNGDFNLGKPGLGANVTREELKTLHPEDELMEADEVQKLFSGHGSFPKDAIGVLHLQKEGLGANEDQEELKASLPVSVGFRTVSESLESEPLVGKDTVSAPANVANKSKGIEEVKNLNAAGGFGSMRKEKEWKRTLAAKLHEERQQEAYGRMEKGWIQDGMDQLWEVYEVDSAEEEEKARVQAREKTTKKRNLDAYEGDRGMNSQLCCLQAIRFSTARMSFGIGKLQPVKISKALKGMGLFARR